jgi:hypothetical protein
VQPAKFAEEHSRPEPTNQDLITQAEEALEQLQAWVLQIEDDLEEPVATLLQSLTPAHDALQSLTGDLQAFLDRLEAYQDALVDPDNSTLQDWEDALELFEIQLTVVEGGLGPNDTGWDKDAERVRAAYKAVYRIISRIADASYNNDLVAGALQFVQTFGVTTLQLTLHRVDEQGIRTSTPYAETQNPGGSIIFLYTDPDPEYLTTPDSNRGYVVHTAENITHEFGHVLVFRNGSDNSGIYTEWAGSLTVTGISQYISPFPPTLGWGDNAGNLQNTSEVDIEHERIANMFEAFVTGYQPAINSANATERRAAWAMWTFMTGIEPPSDVCIDLTQTVRPVGSGLMHWVQLYG